MENRYGISLQIAQIPIYIASVYPVEKIYFRKVIQKFFSSNRKPRVFINVHYDKVPRIVLQEKNLIFKTEKLWSLYQTNGRYVFIHEPINYRKTPISIKSVFYKGRILNFPLTQYYDIKFLKEELPLPYRVSIFERDFSRGEVYIKLPPQRLDFLPNPLANNLLELIVSGILYLCRLGIVLHSCGVKDGNQGYLFVGPIGAGKSTMAKLWKNQGVILHDDRIIIRKIRRDFWIFPTPCYGTIGPTTNQRVKLKKIFFIYHDRKNNIAKQTFGEALSGFLTQTQSDTPLWYPGYKKVIKFNSIFCMELVKDVPCYSLGFVPDKRIIDLVRGIK